jgi:integrase
MGVSIKRGWLYVTFYEYLPDGEKTQFREALGLEDNKKNRKYASNLSDAINKAIKFEKFNYLDWFPHGAKAHLIRLPEGNVLFKDWWEKWLSEKTLRNNTEKGWNSSYRVHISPFFGNKTLNEITEHDILVFRKSLESKLRPNSINDKIMKPLRMCLLKAYKRQMIEFNPCDEISRLAEQPTDIDPFSFEELRAFLDYLKPKKPMYFDMIFIWSRTGFRPGELCALKWEHIDFFNRKALVRVTLHPGGIEGPPKTSHSIRDVDLRPPVIEALKRQEARTGLMDSYVFMTEANKPFSDAFMRKKFLHLLKLAKLKHRPPKQMRHTFATLHLAAGEQPEWIKNMLGHSDVHITLRKYSRFVPNLTRDDGSAFEKIMDGEAKHANENKHHLSTKAGN